MKWLPALRGHALLQELRAFTQGYYKMPQRVGRIVASDVRIAQEPKYEFAFAVAERRATPAAFVRLLIALRDMTHAAPPDFAGLAAAAVPAGNCPSSNRPCWVCPPFLSSRRSVHALLTGSGARFVHKF